MQSDIRMNEITNNVDMLQSTGTTRHISSEERTQISPKQFDAIGKWAIKEPALRLASSSLLVADLQDEDLNLEAWCNVQKTIMSHMRHTEAHFAPMPQILRELMFKSKYEAGNLPPVSKVRKFVGQHNSEHQGDRLGQTASDLLCILGISFEPSSSMAEPTDAQEASLQANFEQVFKGNAVTKFEQGLVVYENMYDKARHYGRCISLIQSSGLGKSRLMQMVGKIIPCLTICFRGSSEPRAGWPLRDKAPSVYMVKREYYGEEMSAAFLGALMEEVLHSIELTTHLDGAGFPAYLDRFLDTDTRDMTLEKVTSRACSLLRAAKTDLESKFIQHMTDANASQWHNYLYEKFCHPSMASISTVLQEAGQKRFILALDECMFLNSGAYGLANSPFVPMQGMSLTAMQHIIKAQDSQDYGNFNFWFVFIDTNPTIATLFHVEEDESSTGPVQMHPLPPWSYLGFNVMQPSHYPKIPGRALHYAYLKSFGRPYWSTQPSICVLFAAKKKLYLHPEGRLNPNDLDEVLATFSLRLSLELGTGKAALALSVDGLYRHMRVLERVVDSFVETCVPSEPILAIAAATEMQRDPKITSLAIRTLVRTLIPSGAVVERNRPGGLLCRLLLTLARDAATPPADHKCVKPTLLCNFFDSLLGVTQHPEHLRTQFQTVMEKTYMNFTHFVRLQETIDGEISVDMLYMAWCRGQAFQCVFGQSIMDALIVTYSGDLDQPFDPKKLGYVVWQFKLKNTAAAKPLGDELVGPRIRMSNGYILPQNPIVVVLDLDNSQQFTDGGHCRLTFEDASHPSKTMLGGYVTAHSEELRRWCFNIRGHTSATYPVIRKGTSEIAGNSQEFQLLFDKTIAGAPEGMESFHEANLGMLNDTNERTAASITSQLC